MSSIIPNGIGVGHVGVAPIGTRPILDYTDPIYSQYANSPRIVALLAAFDQCIDPTQNLDAFFDLLWNVQTAQGYGLDVWGRIVGVQRVLQVSGKFFGFSEAGNLSADPFYQSPFYTGPTDTSNYALTDDAYRSLILAKAAANISAGTIPAINQLLLMLFPGRGPCYVTDGGNMSMQYVFRFNLTPVEYAIVTQSGVLPRPTGVSASLIEF